MNGNQITLTTEVIRTGPPSDLEYLQDKVQRYPYENISQLEEEHFWFVVRNERICRLIKSTLPGYKNAQFLEIGSGTGNVLGYLFDNGFENLTGYEVEESGLEISRQRFPQINFEYNNLLDSDTKTRQFDAIGMFDCIEHFESEELPLANARKMLRPGGKLYITVPAHDFLWSMIDELFGHYRRYTKKDLEKVLVNGGFSSIQQVYFMAPLVPLAIIHRKLKPLPDVVSEEEIEALLNRETSIPHPLVNKIMRGLARLEHNLMGMNDLSFGGSILAVATRTQG
ncbi:MAG: class I SAM-dependent methyltransferase [Cyanobacteriota/Melainabacteria group bacterium]